MGEVSQVGRCSDGPDCRVTLNKYRRVGLESSRTMCPFVARELQLSYIGFRSRVVSNLFLTLLYAILRVNPTSIVSAIDTSCRRLCFAVCWQTQCPNLGLCPAVLCCLYRDSIRLTIGLGLGRSRTDGACASFRVAVAVGVDVDVDIVCNVKKFR